ncbi:hypothetical protein [Streptomyces qinzhouensis]|uniref:Uncharacterized protein n=1 Tax=Streptomyces qinzhouensis TaxID=2599401 RepID=A0A5B8IM27_9ACTN|nr:hypothetical protein [Streptomyces qinzhouensis]QDY79648.1 hypothetical protein FQU76_27435 [Streptomyces qinzhouensis]
MRPATVKATLLVLMAGLLSGCGSSQPEGTRVPDHLDRSTVDMVTNTGDYPARQYQVALVDLALTRKCMRDAGIPWKGGVHRPHPDADEGGGVGADWVRQHGYGLSEAKPSDGQNGQNGQAGDSDHPRLRETLLGPPTALAKLTAPGGIVYWYPKQGCAAKAHASVYGDLDTWARITYLPQEIGLGLFGKATSDRRYRAALGRWRTCMSQYGYTYDSPSSIASALSKAFEYSSEPLDRRRKKEITIAVQDLGCNQQVGLSRTGLRLRREFARTIEPRQRAEMTRLSGLFTEAEQRSRILSR